MQITNTQRSKSLMARANWFAASVLIAITAASSLAVAREWSDTTGKFRVEAEYVGMQDGLVLLKKENGITIGVPPTRLSQADQDFLKSLTDGAPTAAGEGVDLGSIESAEEYVRTVTDAVYSGDMKTAWDALPASYQADVNDVVHQFGEKMDRQLWNKGFSIASKAVGVLRDKKEFILGHPIVQAEQSGELAKNWDVMVGNLTIIVRSEISELDKVRTLDVGAYLATTGQKLVQNEALRAESSGGIFKFAAADLKITTISQDGDTAVLEIDGPKLADAAAMLPIGAGPPGLGAGDEFGAPAAEEPEGPEQVEFVRIEGRWIPKDMADGWADGIARAKAGIDQISDPNFAETKQGAMLVMAMIEGAVLKFDNANSQEEFNQVIDEFGQMFGGMMGGAAGPGGDPFGAPDAAPGAVPAADPFGADPFGN